MSKIIFFTLFVVAICMAFGQTAHATKRALVIGIGQQEDHRWAKINGDKDVTYVTEMLKKAGYGDIRTLVNQQATKNGIVVAFKKLAESCRTGDMVYIHFSGHGQQVTDVSGDEGLKDVYDEAWIPYDAYIRYSPNYKGENHLIDDEVNVLLSCIRSRIGSRGKMLVVVDACHSADSDRGSNEEVVRGTSDKFEIPVKKRGRAKKAPFQWLTLSACTDKQVNYEMKGLAVGKLTYALSLFAGKGLTKERIDDFMEEHRPGNGRPQTPVLAGQNSVNYNISDFFNNDNNKIKR